MKGGFNNPPNATDADRERIADLASMKGGFNNPPNPRGSPPSRGGRARFNEGGVQ